MRALAVIVAALGLTASAAAALPQQGVFAPGRSLGGIRLGEDATAVRAALGSKYGVCTGCGKMTWYFTYKPFDQHGLGIELTRGRVSAVYTLWQPGGWHATNGVRLGALEAQLTIAAGPLIDVSCPTYDARVIDRPTSRSVYYVVGGKLWGFGLFQARANPCR
jgi:hypothetical protein